MNETRRGTIPPPREGPLGEWDRFVGPGASRWENAGTLGFVAVGAVAASHGPTAAASGRRQWRSAAISYTSLVGAAALLELASSERKRGLASGLYTAWLASTSIVAPPSGYARLPSLLGFKLLLGHGTPRGSLSVLRRRRVRRTPG